MGSKGPSPVVWYAPEAMEWEPHPFARGLDQVVLLSHREHGADATVYLYRGHPTEDGSTEEIDVPLHSHETFDDISYIFGGAATIDIEGHGSIRLTAGSFLRVPAGLKHRVYDATDDFQAINVFAPPRE